MHKDVKKEKIDEKEDLFIFILSFLEIQIKSHKIVTEGIPIP